MKRILTFGLSFAVLISASGCAKKEAEKRETVKWAGVPSVSVEKGSETERYLEDRYNINIEVMNTESDEKLSAMIASGNIPDVMFLREPEIWIPFARQDVLAPLTEEQIRNNAPRHSEAIDKKNKKLWFSGMDGGQMWTIPQLSENEFVHVGIIRKDWLENVGIKTVPRTLDEYEEVFRRFSMDDPDGNGKNDTYGLTGMGGHQARQFDSIFGAFGVMPGQWKASSDGKIALDTVSPKAKEALTLLNRWYESGYIHPECVTDTVESNVSKFLGGLVGVTFDSANLFFDNTTIGKSNLEKLKSSNENAELCFAYPPEGNDGKIGSYMWGPRTNFVGFGKQMSTKPETLNKILNILDDLCYDEELFVRERWGVLGKHYEYIEAENGGELDLAYIEPYSDLNVRKKAGLGGFFNLFKGTPSTGITNIPENVDVDMSIITIESKECEDVLLRMFLPSDIELQEKLDEFKSVSYSKFIIGERSLEEWDSFVNEFMAMGGAQLTKEAQILYDDFLK